MTQHDVALVLQFAGLAVMVPGAVCLARRQYLANIRLCALGCGLHMIGVSLAGRTVYAALDAAVVAYALWLWWNNGGGDNTRRRLRRWAARFRGVRRTAPAAGTA